LAFVGQIHEQRQMERHLPELSFSSSKCDHGDGIGTDILAFYEQFSTYDQKVFDNNKKSFFVGQPLKATIEAAKQLSATLVKSFFNVDVEKYLMAVKNQNQSEHFELFTMAAIQTIYGHVTYYFGLQDLFKQHEEFIISFVNKNNCTFNPISAYKSRYDDILSDALNKKNPKLQDVRPMVQHLCQLYRQEFIASIADDIKVIRSIYYFLNDDLLHNGFKFTYMVENLKKTGCGCQDHNLSLKPYIFQEIEHIHKLIYYQKPRQIIYVPKPGVNGLCQVIKDFEIQKEKKIRVKIAKKNHDDDTIIQIKKMETSFKLEKLSILSKRLLDLFEGIDFMPMLKTKKIDKFTH